MARLSLVTILCAFSFLRMHVIVSFPYHSPYSDPKSFSDLSQILEGVGMYTPQP